MLAKMFCSPLCSMVTGGDSCERLTVIKVTLKKIHNCSKNLHKKTFQQHRLKPSSCLNLNFRGIVKT